jgi:hypothetical protein
VLMVGALVVAVHPHETRADTVTIFPHVDVVFEEYWPTRPSGADTVIALLRKQMSDHANPSFVGPEEARKRLHYWHVSATNDPNVTSAMVLHEYTLGKKEWQHGEPDAQKVLDEAEALGQANGPATAQIENLQPYRIGALLARALSRQAAGDAHGASEAMSDLIRIYPDVVITLPSYSSDAAALYAKTLAQLQKSSPGILHVEAPGCEIHIDEVHRGTNKLDFVELPGTYRVLLQCGAEWWRNDVEIAEGRTASMAVNATLQDFLEWSGWFGLHFMPTQRGLELERLQAMAELLGVKGVAGIVSVQEDRNEAPVIVAKLYNTRSKTIVAEVATHLGTGHDPEHLDAIAAFLTMGPVAQSPLLEHLGAAPGPPQLATRAQVSEHAHVHASSVPVSLLTFGGLAVVAGATMLALGHPSKDDQAWIGSNLRIPGAFLLDAGVAAGALGTYFLLNDDHRMWPAAVGAAVAVALVPVGAWYVHIDNDEACGLSPPVQCRYLNGTAWAGWPMIGIGVAGAGLAVGWYLHERRHPRLPPHEARVPTTAIVPTRGGAFAALSWKW